MTNYQINTLAKVLKQNGISEVCAVLAGDQSGFSYIFNSLSSENRLHIWFALNTQMTSETYGKSVIWSAFVPSGKLTELLAFLEIPSRNPAL